MQHLIFETRNDNDRDDVINIVDELLGKRTALQGCRRRDKMPRVGRFNFPHPIPPIGELVRLTSLPIGIV